MNLRSIQPWHVALAGTALVALFVAIWPLGLGRDYLNHLARTYIEGHVGSDPHLSQFYSVSFDFIPDLTMDMIIPLLSQLTGIYAAGAVTIWLAFILPPLAGIALAKTLQGRVTWVSLLGFLTVFNANMDWGFVNYNASVGLGLFAFVLWVRLQPSRRRTLIFAPVTLFLVINHALAFLLFGFLAFVWEVTSYHKKERGTLSEFLRELVLKAGPAMLPGLMYLYLSTQGAADLPQGFDPLYHVGQKTRSLIAATEFGNVALAYAVTLALVGFAWMGVRQKWVTFSPKTGWLCAAMLGLVILVPSSIFGIWGLHLRFVSPLVILFAACIQVTPAFTPNLRRIGAGLFAALGVLSFANGAGQMADLDRQGRTLQTVLAEVPKGAKVLNAVSSLEHEPAFAPHAISLATIERSAFVPGLFTNTSPVDIQPEMAALHMPQPPLFTPVELEALAPLAPRPSENGYWSQAYAHGWPQTWDYLVFFKSAEAPGLEDLPVCEVKSTPRIILYATGPCQ